MIRVLTLVLCYALSFFATAQDPLLNRIPKSSLFVSTLKVSDLLEKIDLHDITKLDMMLDLKNNMKKEAKKDSSIVSQLFKDPSVYGLYLQPNMHLYLEYENINTPTPSIGLLFPLKTGKKLEKLIIKTAGKDVFKEKFEKKKNYTWFENRDFAFAYTKDYLLLYNFRATNSALTLDEKIQYLINGNPESITSNQDFMDFHRKKADFSYWMNTEHFFNSIFHSSNEKQKEFLSYFDNLKDISLGYRINFNNGKIEYHTETFLPDELSENLNKIYGSGIPDYMLKHLSQEDLHFVFGAAFNMQEVENMAKKTFKEITQLIAEKAEEELQRTILDYDPSFVERKNQIEQDTTLGYFEKFEAYDQLDAEKDSILLVKKEQGEKKIDSTLAEYGTKKEDLWSLFNGNIVVALNGTTTIVDTFDTYDYIENEDGDFGYFSTQKTRLLEIPLFQLMLDTKHPEKIVDLLDSIHTKGFLQKENNHYYVSFTQYDYYAFIRDGSLFFTNNKALLSENTTNHPLDATYHHALNNNPSYMYWDLQKTLDIISKNMQDYSANIAFQEAKNTFESITSTTVLTENTTESKLTVNLTQKEENALLSIFKMFNNIYLSFMPKR